MALKRMVLEIGMGTDIRGADSTKAAVRALRDALWHNSLSVATALGKPLEAMQVEVTIGVPRPETVDKAAVLAVLPYGKGTINVVEVRHSCISKNSLIPKPPSTKPYAPIHQTEPSP